MMSDRPVTHSPINPLTFDPVFKDYPWGGRNLETVFGRTLPEGIVAESWEIAAHPNGSSTVNRPPADRLRSAPGEGIRASVPTSSPCGG